MVCAQCHSFRDTYALGFTAGADYYDYFLPVLEYGLPDEGDPAYWADGRTRRFSNDAFGLWQSECFLKGGATCLTCHAIPHNTDIDRIRSSARTPTRSARSVIRPSERPPRRTPTTPSASTGSSCVECHMPRTVYSIKAEIRDHSMTVPVPENTLHHDIPNACNLCHKDKSPEWAIAQMNQWYGDRSRQKMIRRADAFAAARKGDPAAVPALLAILGEPGEGQLVRANAAGYLGRYRDPAAFEAVLRATADREPLVRTVATLSLAPGADHRQAAAEALVKGLGDPVATVRLASLVALVSLGVHDLPGEDGQRFESAKQLFQARAQFNSDDAQQQLAAGRFYLLAADPAKAAQVLEEGLKLDPTAPGQYLLAGADYEQKEFAKARQILEAIPASGRAVRQGAAAAQGNCRAGGALKLICSAGGRFPPPVYFGRASLVTGDKIAGVTGSAQSLATRAPGRPARARAPRPPIGSLKLTGRANGLLTSPTRCFGQYCWPGRYPPSRSRRIGRPMPPR